LYSCEAYCEAHLHKKIQKIQKNIAFRAAINAKSRFGSLGPLGVNPKMLPAPSYGIWMTINMPRWKIKAIFHSTMFEATY
jgi:hypothetical protein